MARFEDCGIAVGRSTSHDISSNSGMGSYRFGQPKDGSVGMLDTSTAFGFNYEKRSGRFISNWLEEK